MNILKKKMPISILILLLGGHTLSFGKTAMGSSINIISPRTKKHLPYVKHTNFYVSAPTNLCSHKKKRFPLKSGTPYSSRNKKTNPRRELLATAPIHTQRSWMYSALLPGLGQAYNQQYWKIGLIYGIGSIFAIVVYYNSKEYTTTKREILEQYEGKKMPSYSNLQHFMEERKRDFTLWSVFLGMWYLINIFDAYVGGTLKTFDISDDLSIVIQPTPPQELTKASFGININLQPNKKDADRFNRVW